MCIVYLCLSVLVAMGLGLMGRGVRDTHMCAYVMRRIRQISQRHEMPGMYCLLAVRARAVPMTPDSTDLTALCLRYLSLTDGSMGVLPSLTSPLALLHRHTHTHSSLLA